VTQLLRGSAPEADSDDAGGQAREDTASDLPRARGTNRRDRAAAFTVVIGLLLTATSAWAAYQADTSTEDRLLETQTLQAATVLSTAILTVEQPLMIALQVQSTTAPDGNPAVFRRTFSASMDADRQLVSASLWHQEPGGTFTRLTAVGDAPGMDPRGSEVQDFLQRAQATETSVVEQIAVGDQSRIAYALGDPTTGFVVKVERAIPANRRATVDNNSAFSKLDYGIYLGEETRLPALLTTNVDPADLPMEGNTYSTKIDFGDTKLTLVMRSDGHLGSDLSRWLPLLLLLGGLLLTLATALVTRQLIGARIRVEADSATIKTLYQRNNTLFEDQRALFLRLQRALLPHVIPDIPQLEVASKYVAGADGIEIGGDWYSIVAVGEDHFGFVVGDVSGRGVDAVAEMARARFTLRAYLLDGNSPAEALAKSSAQFDIAVDDHIVTAVVGLGTWKTGEVVVANAGHPLPLLMSADGSDYVRMPVGPPLGVGASSYESTTFTMPEGSTLVAYTDGLVERRGEDIDAGMQRLVDAADRHRHESLSDLLTSVLDALRDMGASDDIAMLALRRLPPGS
jgi:serine phosphatase RsbU (regulator of sigma subunit)